MINTACQWFDDALHLQREEQGGELTDGDVATHAEDIQLQVVGLV